MISFSLVILISEWAIRLIMVPVVVARRRTSAALAWITLIAVIPWVGLILYMLIGNHRLGRRRSERHRRITRALNTLDRLGLQKPFRVTPPEHGPQASARMLAKYIGAMDTLGGNDVQWVSETDAFIEQLIRDIDAAEHHVHLMFYIYDDDDVGRRVGDALIRAAQRGVATRLLVDAVGGKSLFRGLARKLRQQGVDVYAAMPVHLIRRAFARMDLRNHRKLVVIDGRLGYVGSQNIVNRDYGHRDLAWFDLAARIQGPSVFQCQLVFMQDWYFESGQMLNDAEYLPDPQACGEVAMQVVPSGPTEMTQGLITLYVHAIHTACKQLTITTPYIVPDEPSLLALQSAARRGVQVNLVVPHQSDHPIVAMAGRSYYRDLLEAGVRIYQFKKGLLHSKTLTVDHEFALLGSCNFDIRSFYLNFELNLLLFGEQTTAQLRDRQQRYIEQSEPIDHDQWLDRPYLRRLSENVAGLFSDLL